MGCAAGSATRSFTWTPRDGYFRVPYGALVDEPTLKPVGHMFVASKAPWHEILDDVPQYDEYPWT